MKPIAAFVFGLSILSSTAFASEAKIGLVKCRTSSGNFDSATHGIYFTKKKEWKGETVFEDLTLPSLIAERKKTKAPSNEKFQVTFDGKIIATLELPPRTEELTPLPPAVREKCQWLIKNKRSRALLTTSLAKFSDPEKWKPALPSKMDLKMTDLDLLFKGFQACKKPNTAPPSASAMTIGQFVSGRAYLAGDGKRALIEFKSLCPEPFEETKEHYHKDAKMPWAVWLYREGNGKWFKQPNLDLVDIGDFDGDGKSEAVFFAGFPIPQGYWGLVSLANFDKVVIADDQGY